MHINSFALAPAHDQRICLWAESKNITYWEIWDKNNCDEECFVSKYNETPQVVFQDFSIIVGQLYIIRIVSFLGMLKKRKQNSQF